VLSVNARTGRGSLSGRHVSKGNAVRRKKWNFLTIVWMGSSTCWIVISFKSNAILMLCVRTLP
jgi:hypothetical protein